MDAIRFYGVRQKLQNKLFEEEELLLSDMDDDCPDYGTSVNNSFFFFRIK